MAPPVGRTSTSGDRCQASLLLQDCDPILTNRRGRVFASSAIPSPTQVARHSQRAFGKGQGERQRGTAYWRGPDPRFLTGGNQLMDPHVTGEREPPIDRSRGGRSAIPQPSESENPEVSQFRGEMFHTLFGNLNGVYTWECDHVPSEDAIRDLLCLRVVRDCGHFGKRNRCAELAAWHGGWTREGIGIFSADIWTTSRRKRARHLGHACVRVRTPNNSGSRTWNGVAC
jgi:hypothetical protein